MRYLTQSGRPGKGFSEKVVFEKRVKDKEELILNKRGGKGRAFQAEGRAWLKPCDRRKLDAWEEVKKLRWLEQSQERQSWNGFWSPVQCHRWGNCHWKEGSDCQRLQPESLAETGFKPKFLNSQPSGLSSTSLGFPAYEEEKSQLGASKMLHLGTENRRGYF